MIYALDVCRVRRQSAPGPVVLFVGPAGLRLSETARLDRMLS